MHLAYEALRQESVMTRPHLCTGERVECGFPRMTKSDDAGLYFKLPPDQVVEIGVQVDL
jgi:hypothetical protein